MCADLKDCAKYANVRVASNPVILVLHTLNNCCREVGDDVCGRQLPRLGLQTQRRREHDEAREAKKQCLAEEIDAQVDGCPEGKEQELEELSAKYLKKKLYDADSREDFEIMQLSW